jgi:hypothetical protein
MNPARNEEKSEPALKSIASRYRAAIVDSYQINWILVFSLVMDLAFNGKAPDWRAFTPIKRCIQ